MVSSDGRTRTLDTLNTLYQEAFEILANAKRLRRTKKDARDATTVAVISEALRSPSRD